MISPETRAQIRRYFYVEHWKVGTIASQLGVHPDAVRNAIESERFHNSKPLGVSVVDPYIEFIRHTLEQHPRLRATRIYQMIRDRGYSGTLPTARCRNISTTNGAPSRGSLAGRFMRSPNPAMAISGSVRRPAWSDSMG